MLYVPWKKEGDLLFIDLSPGCGRVSCTREDLEEGLRLLNEKPIFEAYTTTGKRCEFQKRDGLVHHRFDEHGRHKCWRAFNNDWRLTSMSESQVEAYLKALRS